MMYVNWKVNSARINLILQSWHNQKATHLITRWVAFLSKLSDSIDCYMIVYVLNGHKQRS